MDKIYLVRDLVAFHEGRISGYQYSWVGWRNSYRGFDGEHYTLEEIMAKAKKEFYIMIFIFN